MSCGMVETLVSFVVLLLSVLESHPLLASFQVMLLEHIIMCRLITGNKTIAIQEVRRDVAKWLAASKMQKTIRLLFRASSLQH